MVKNTLRPEGVRRERASTGRRRLGRADAAVPGAADSVKDLANGRRRGRSRTSKKDPKAPDKFKVKTAVADGQPVPCRPGQDDADPRWRRSARSSRLILGPASSIAGCPDRPGGQVASQILKTIEEKKPEGEAAPAAEPRRRAAG